MDNILALGIILFFSVISGRIANFFSLPMVTGYILAGIILGKSYFNFINDEMIKNLHIFADIAIGFIIFSIGGVFKFNYLKNNFKKILTLSISESFLTFLLVLIFSLIYSFFAPLNIIVIIFLSIIAISTAPAATIMVLREYDSEGPITNYLYSLLGLNNFLSIFLFSMADMVFILFNKSNISAESTIMPIYLQPMWLVIGSIIFGIMLGIILAYFEHNETNENQILVYVIAAILLSLVLSEKLHLSFLIINLFMGITVINITSKSEPMFEILKNSDPPLYAIFFVLAGAKFDISILKAIGILGIGYFVMRGTGKIIGTYIAGKKLNEDENVYKYLGIALLPQAGLAISLAQFIANDYGNIGNIIFTLVVSTSIIYETLGPIFTKIAIFKAGEVKTEYLVNINTIFKLKSKSQSFFHHFIHKIKLILGTEKISHTTTVADQMITDFFVIKDTTPYKIIVDFLKKAPYSYLPVVDKDNNYIGVVTAEEVKEILFTETINNIVIARDIADENLIPVVYPEMHLIETLPLFNKKFISYLIVLKEKNSKKIIGILDKTDVLLSCKRLRERKLFYGK